MTNNNTNTIAMISKIQELVYTDPEQAIKDAVDNNIPLWKIDFTNASLNGCDLSGKDFSGCCLLAANLRGADLSGCKFQGASLKFAQLQGADLIEANLDGACLDRAFLMGANFSGASFYRATMHAAWVRGATFTGAKHLDTCGQEDLEKKY